MDLGNLVLGLQIPGLAMLDALDARLAVMDRTQHNITIGVNTGAVTAAEAQVTSLGAAHQALGGKTAALGMDVSQVESARTSVKNLDNDLLSLVSTAGKVGPALAAGVAAAGLTKFAADYQTLMVTTANQTSLANDEIATLDKTVRGLPSGNAPLADLATGFKNITDLGYSAADATKIASEESKAATEAGANQATTMLAITSAMKEYNATADQVGKYSNIVAEAAKLGNTSLQAWTEGTRTGVAVAAAYGVSLQEADAFMVALTRHGFDAAESATQLRGVIQHIVNPNEAAQKEIASITKSTGIDLVGDFSDAGLKARGFAQVMADLQAVVDRTGDESIITKLIPALRGGQGALISVTQAAQDSKEALGLLGQAADGSLTPVEDGFDRISKTAGYQFGQTMKDLKFDMIDLGNTFLPAATSIIEALDKIPSGAVKVAAEVGLAFAAIKGAGAVADLLTTSTARLGAAMEGETAAVTADTVALTENAAARDLDATAAQGLAAKIGSTVAGLGKGLGSIVVPVAITLAAYEIVGKPLEDAIRQKVSELERPGANIGTLNTDDDAAFEAGIRARLDTQQKIVDEYNNYKGSAGYKFAKIENLGGELQSDRDYKNAMANIAALKQAELDYQQVHHNTVELGPPLPANYGDSAHIDMRSPADQYASDLDYSKQIATDAKAAATSQAAYEKQMAADILASQKAGDAEALKSRNQANTDAATLAKRAAQETGDAQVAAATASANAWKAANSEVAKIASATDLSAIAATAQGLDTARADLAALGESNTHLDALAKVADTMQSIADATGKATAAYRGFSLTLGDTDKNAAALDSIQKRYLQALDAAQQRQRSGTASADDNALVASRNSVLDTFAAQQQRLSKDASGDLLKIVQNLPDFAAINKMQMDTVAAAGGGEAVIARIQSESAAAERELAALEKKDRQTIVTAKAETADAVQKIDDYLKHINALPLDRTLTIHTNIAPQDAPGSVSGAQGNDGVASGQAMGTISLADYQKVLSQYPGSPLNNPQSLGDINSVAQQMGVDPRTLMAVMQTESGYGQNAGLIGKQFNYGGMGVNDRGFGHDSGVHATDGGPEYAGYDDFKSFLMDISGWIRQNGSSFSNYQTADGGQAKNATMAQLQGALPLSGTNVNDPTRGYGALVTTDRGYGPGTPGLGSGQTSTGGLAPGATGPRADIVNAAMQDIGLQGFVDQCEKWVEEKVQQATGQRGATGTNEPDASTGFRDAQAKGLVRPANQAPQAGDLVYYPDAAGGVGHVAIYVGAGQQISTWDKGDPNNPTNQKIHQEAISPGARFVMVPGTESDTSRPRSNVADPQQGFAPPAGTVPTIPTIDGTTGGVKQAQAAVLDLSASMTKLNQLFAQMDAPAIKATRDSFTSILPVLDTMQQKVLANGRDLSTLTATDKQDAMNAAVRQGIQYETDFAQTVKEIENGTVNLDSATQKLAADVGGPLAQAYGQAAVASAQITAANAQIAVLQKQQAAADTAHQAALAGIQAQGQAAQQASQAAQQAQQAQSQAAANANQDAQTAENNRYTQVQRREQDRQRALQFSQQVQATDLQNSLTDTQKQQQSQIYQRTSAEQVQSATVRGAGTNTEAAAAAAVLAKMHDQDLAQRDLNTKAIDNIQLQIREQAKQANLESYNLQTETIQQQRKHEDIMAGLAAQATAQQRASQAASQALAAQSQQQQASIQAATQAENTKYQAEKDANTKAIADQQAIKDTAQASLDTAQQALDVWQQTGVVIANAAASAASSAGASSAAASNPFGTPAYTRKLGTFAGGTAGYSGMGIVGDSPDGDMSYAEAVFGTYTVIPHAESVSRGLVPASSGGSGGGTTVNLNLGDLSLAISDEDRAELTALMQRIADKAKKAGIAQKRALGVN